MGFVNLQSFKICLAIGLGVWLNILPLSAIAVEFKPPRRSIPGRREGGGTRSPSCVQGDVPLTVLLPQTNIGLTTATHPQFFWFMPQTRAESMKFTLFQGDEQNPEQELIYETTIAIPAQPGIVSVALPQNATVPQLEVGREYFWTIALICQANEPSKNIYAQGWIERVSLDPTLTKRLKTAQPSDRAQLYAQNGIWFDTLATLAEMQCPNPQPSQPTQSWTQLLESVKLDRLAKEPLSQVCQK